MEADESLIGLGRELRKSKGKQCFKFPTLAFFKYIKNIFEISIQE